MNIVLVPAVAELRLIKLPAVHDTVNVVYFCIVDPGKVFVCAADPSSLKSLNMLAPVIVFVPVLAHRENHTLLNVCDPHAKVTALLLELVILKVDVFTLIVHVHVSTEPVPVNKSVSVH